MYITLNEIEKERGCATIGEPLIRSNINWFKEKDSVMVVENMKTDYTQYGYVREQTVLKLFYLIDNINEVYLSTTNSLLDRRYAVDLYFNYLGSDISYGIQIKASLRGACKYLNKKNKINNITGLVWISEKCTKYNILQTISEWIGQPIKEEAYEAIKIANKYSGLSFPTKILKFSSVMYNTFNILSLADIKNNNIIFR